MILVVSRRSFEVERVVADRRPLTTRSVFLPPGPVPWRSAAPEIRSARPARGGVINHLGCCVGRKSAGGAQPEVTERTKHVGEIVGGVALSVLNGVPDGIVEKQQRADPRAGQACLQPRLALPGQRLPDEPCEVARKPEQPAIERADAGVGLCRRGESQTFLRSIASHCFRYGLYPARGTERAEAAAPILALPGVPPPGFTRMGCLS